MIKQKLISVIVLFMMSFSVLHAYVIDAVDEDHCSISEYVQELDQCSEHEISADICDIHHAFHTPFVLLETTTDSKKILVFTPLVFQVKTYNFQLNNTPIRPPIQL